MKRFCLLACCCSGLLACAGGVEQTVGLDTDAGSGVDAAVDVILKSDVVEVVDLLHQHDAHDISVEVVGPQCNPGEGCFLDQCFQNSDCDSGWCVDNMGEGVCTKLCEEECPPGWTCAQIAGSAPDIVFACVSNHANLCRPCTTGKDCESIGGAEDVCVAYGDAGSFCGGKCNDEAPCPYGFSCQEALTVDGIETVQCVAVSGVCPCTKKSVELSLWTSCARSSEWGKCIGKRVCKEEGLSDCDAPTPAEEVCDGEDNDCDGDVDEPDLVDGDFVNLCDDGNDCTDDSCKGTDGCVNAVLDSGACDDDNPCTVADHCEVGNCTGTTVECDDQNPCTENVCTETGGCSFLSATGPCDDGNPCTLADQCQDSKCAGVEMPCDCQDDADCATLEDGDLCNGTLVCDKSKLPYHCAVKEGTVVVCPGPPAGPDAFCLEAACDALSGSCSLVPDHEGLFCDDGDACTVNDKCVQGACVAGMPLNCNDGNSCTDDACDAQNGCASTPNTAPCEDGDVCTSQDKCADGKCVGGPTLGCDDGNPCSSDFCAPGEGCLHQDVDGACDDGDACTTGDSCMAGICKGSGQLDCDDGKVCTTDGCDAAAGCVYKLNQAPCDDGSVCTYGDHCHLGECISSSSLGCNDGNPCTDDSCSPLVGCVFTPNKKPCDDGNACTIADLCSGGLCVAGGLLACDDDMLCTKDSCDSLVGCMHSIIKLCCGNGLVEPPEQCDEGGVPKGECSANCMLPACDDGAKNGGESDIDCGGPCALCKDGAVCLDKTDCESGVCQLGKCLAPKCDDGVANGTETDIDCGGNVCPACLVGKLCKTDGDCAGQALCSPAGQKKVCACKTGYVGNACDACAQNYQDNDKNGTCLPNCTLAALNCSGHGACSDAAGSAVCVCVLGYAGPNCNLCAPGYSLNESDGTCLVATPVCGMLTVNTVWPANKSPYLAQCTVQVPEGITLTIEPGVTVLNSGGGNMFKVYGTLWAHGTVDKKIFFVGPAKRFFDMGDTSPGTAVTDVTYASIKNGENLYWGGHGHLVLRYSQVENVSGSSYVWYPQKDSYVEFNVFSNSGGFSIGAQIIKVYIRNNLFVGASKSGSWVENWTATVGSQTIVKYNTFHNPSGTILSLPPGYTGSAMVAAENYWGTEDTAQIDKWIFDKKDDMTCAGNIPYLPVLAQPHPDTPTP